MQQLYARCYRPVLVMVLYFIIHPLSAQTGSCNNLDFESCDFSAWRLYEAENQGTEVFGYEGKTPTSAWGNVIPNSTGRAEIEGNRYTQFGITSGGSFLIERRGETYNLPLVNPNAEGACTALVGDFFEDDAYIAMLEREIAVTTEVNALILRYAVAMEDPGHSPREQPYFSLNLFTPDGTSIDCVRYTAVAGDGQEGWIDIGGRYSVKPWSELYVPLKDYEGQTLRLEVIAADCSKGGHAGFALVDIICVKNEIEISAVNGCEFPYKLSAPPGGSSYEWSTGETGSSIEVDQPGEYTVKIIPFNGEDCSVTLSQTVDPLPTIELAVSPDPTICAGETANLSVSGSVNYTWSPAIGLSDPNSSNPQASPPSTTTYTVTGTDNGGCATTSQVTVTVNPMPVVYAGADQTICAGDTLSLNGSGTGTIKWNPALYLSDASLPNPEAFPEFSATYTLAATTSAGCSATDEVSITVNQAPDLKVGNDATICHGDTAQLSASGAQSYQWSQGTALSNPSIPNPIAVPNGTTTFIVRGSTAEGCTALDSIRVSVNPLPPVNAGPDQTLCPFGQSRLEATGASSYVWTPANGLSNPNIAKPMVNGIQNISYTVMGIDANGCSNTDEINITLNEIFELDAGPDTTICMGESFELSVSGGSNYTWTPSTGLSNPNIANPIANPNTTIQYIIRAVDPNGCDGTDSITVNVVAAPDVELGPDLAVCEGENLRITASGADSYEWKLAEPLPNSTGPLLDFIPTKNQQIMLIGSNSNGCQDKDSIALRINKLPTLNAGPDVNACMGAETQLLAEGAMSYSWVPSSGLSNSRIANPLATLNQTTTFTVTGTDSNGCIGTDEVTLKIAEELSPFAGNDTSICVGDTVFLKAVGGTTYQWEPAIGLSNPNIHNPVVTIDSTITYDLTVFDNLGCTGFDQVRIVVNPVPDLDAGPDISICEGTEAQLNASGATWYAWTPRDHLSDAFIADPIVQSDSSITYTLYGISEFGCVSEDQLRVTYVENILLDAGPDMTICHGDTVDLRVEGGSNYNWFPALGLSSPDLANPMAFPDQTTMYVVSAEDGVMCSSQDSILITVNPSPDLQVPEDPVICFGDSILAPLRGAETYRWSPARGLSDAAVGSPLLYPHETISYTLTGSNQFGCEDTGSLRVTVNPLPILDPGEYNDICEGDDLQLVAKGAKYYDWLPPIGLSDPSIRDPLANPIETTIYTLIGTDQNGCQSSIDLEIEVLPEPIADFQASDSLGVKPSTISFNNQSLHAEQFRWDFGDGDSSTVAEPSHIYEEADQYWVRLIASNRLGCADTALQPLEILPVRILVPTGFTPNGDGVNENFFIGITEAIQSLHVQIFNRWGEMIYEADEIDFKWDGTYKGYSVQEGTYVCKVAAWDIEGRKYTQATTVTLIR